MGSNRKPFHRRLLRIPERHTRFQAVKSVIIEVHAHRRRANHESPNEGHDFHARSMGSKTANRKTGRVKVSPLNSTCNGGKEGCSSCDDALAV
ncbi:hypothetical protein M404DRAFT_992489 [Pisolithus tinctorius Marx 270]|uniref:Uncharacterized protein n=1 Tax=Pisolithus tinctorius Marx 270 TaxID=870435 RepID=A0A0C3PXM8_PISTI|nr:hypothetical protein M404DRAFT_992489 [Pisolithus tinctorius Marx 270]